MSDAAKADKQAGLSCFYLRKLTKMVEAPLYLCVFYVFMFRSTCSYRSAVKTGGDTITIDPDAKTEDGDSNQIPNPLTVHNSLAELAKAVGFDVKAPTVPAEQGISETEVAAVVSSAL